MIENSDQEPRRVEPPVTPPPPPAQPQGEQFSVSPLQGHLFPVPPPPPPLQPHPFPPPPPPPPPQPTQSQDGQVRAESFEQPSYGGQFRAVDAAPPAPAAPSSGQFLSASGFAPPVAGGGVGVPGGAVPVVPESPGVGVGGRGGQFRHGGFAPKMRARDQSRAGVGLPSPIDPGLPPLPRDPAPPPGRPWEGHLGEQTEKQKVPFWRRLMKRD